MRSMLVVSFALVTACSRDAAAPPQAPVELVIPPVGLVPTAVKTDECKAHLTTDKIAKSSPDCYLDQRVDAGGILTYPCKGDGPAEAYFDSKEKSVMYVGHLVGGVLELAAHTELDWEDDHCRWATDGTIRGRLTDETLAWSYADSVLTGSDCSASCTARGGFALQNLQKH